MGGRLRIILSFVVAGLLAGCGNEAGETTTDAPVEASNMDQLFADLSGGTDSETYPPASEAEIAQTEAAIGLSLPPSYRQFVADFSNGAYLLGIQEVSAVGEGNDQIGPIQSLVGFAGEGGRVEIDEGGSADAADLVPYSLDANGNAWCFLTGNQSPIGEYEVAYFNASNGKLYGRLESFEAWLRRLSEAQDEVIRSLYDAKELDLG